MSELPGGFSRRAVAWMVGIAVFSFLAAILLQAYGGDLSDRPTAGANTFSYSALGYHGLAELLRQEGLGVTTRQTRGGAGPGPGRPLVLAEPDLSGPDWEKHLKAFADEARERQAPLVVVLPKWRGRPRQDRPGWVARVSLLSADRIESVLAALDIPALKGATVERPSAPPSAGLPSCYALGRAADSWRPFTIDVQPLQLLAPAEGLTSEADCGRDLLIAVGSLGRDAPEVFVVADPDLWNNQGLARADHAALAHELFVEHLGARGVVFDETIHGYVRSRGLLAEAFRFPLLPGVLQGLLLLGTLLAAGMGRFGAPLPATSGLAAGKEVLIDNTAQLLAHGGRTADSLYRYYQQTLRAVAARFFLPTNLPEEELAARLQEIGKRKGATLDLAALERRIAGIDPAGRGDRKTLPRAAALAKTLYRWRMEMTDGH
jgi:hypothetical protein